MQMYGKIEGVWVGNILISVLGGEKAGIHRIFSPKFSKGKVKLRNPFASGKSTVGW